jgi:hypothetical protein
MGDVPIIGPRPHICAAVGGAGERLVLFSIGPKVDELTGYTFTPDQARELAQRLLDMANVAENLDDPFTN